MKELVQYSEAELVELLKQDLSANGHKVIPRDFTIEFVTNAVGETSALITGVVGTVTHNVQEDEADEVDGADGADEGTPPARRASGNFRELVYDTIAVTLTKKGHTVDELIDLVGQEVEEQGRELTEDETSSLRVATIKSLQHLEKQGRAEYVDEGELWRTKKSKKPKTIPRVTTLSTAADILGGAGGVLDRGDALSEGASEGRPRQGVTRRKKAPKRRGGGGKGPAGFGSGTPFSF
jgi:hypothetical protein